MPSLICDVSDFRWSSNYFSSKSMTTDAEENSKSGGSDVDSSMSQFYNKAEESLRIEFNEESDSPWGNASER